MHIYLNLCNTICDLSLEHVMYIISDYFHGEDGLEVDFSKYKGTQLWNVIEEAKKERARCKYKGVTPVAGTLEIELLEQFPKEFGNMLLSWKITPEMADQMVKGMPVSRAYGYYLILKSLVSHIEADEEISIFSPKYEEAIKWRELSAKYLEEKINEQLDLEFEKLMQEEEEYNKKREEWLLQRESRIKEEANEIDEEMIIMEQEYFKVQNEKIEIRYTFKKLEKLVLKYMLHEQIKEYRNESPVWFFDMVERKVKQGRECYVHVQTRTLEIDFKIVDPYHIYIIHQMLMEGAKAFRSLIMRDKHLQVIEYLVELDPSPNILINVRYNDTVKTKRVLAFDYTKFIDYEF